jgi:predicted alpha/beta-hydrolase family hydrolase
LTEVGISASALRLPRRDAERAMAALREQVGAQLPTAVIGGHSYGGRVASMVAAQTKCAGLVLLSYPLHRPGHPEELRNEHWQRVGCPVLVLSGDRDQFARVDLLRESVRRLPSAELHVYPGLQHGLQREAADVARRIAAFVNALEAAGAPGAP